MIQFTVYGPIKGKGRPRSFRMKNGAIGTYTPRETAAFEERIRTIAAEHKPTMPIEGPVHLKLECYFLIPKSKRKKNKVLQPKRHITKPDIDNVLKAVVDSLNRLIYYDDAQICFCIVSKEYVEDAERIEVTITPIGD